MTMIVTTRDGERWAISDKSGFFAVNGPQAISDQGWIEVQRLDRDEPTYLRASEIIRIELDGRVAP